MAHDWQPPETAPRDGNTFEVTTGIGGAAQDQCYWDSYFNHFRNEEGAIVLPQWPHMVAWRPIRPEAVVGRTEVESRAANGFPPPTC